MSVVVVPAVIHYLLSMAAVTDDLKCLGIVSMAALTEINVMAYGGSNRNQYLHDIRADLELVWFCLQIFQLFQLFQFFEIFEMVG